MLATKLRSNFALMRRSNPESRRGAVWIASAFAKGFGGQVASRAMTE
jgi:hypothetical protein